MQKQSNYFFLLFGLLISLYQVNACAAKLYKWVDENGRINYQDRPPPQNAKSVEQSQLKNKQTTTKVTHTKVVIYTVENCDLCELTKLKLNRWNIPFSEQSLHDREAQKRILKETSSLIAPTLLVGDKITSNVTERHLKTLFESIGLLTTTQQNKTATNNTPLNHPKKPSSPEQEVYY